MDLITPAKTWAVVEAEHGHLDHHDGPVAPMPRFQQVVMFFAVVGPFAGLVAAIVLFWHRSSTAIGIGWPEVVALFVMYALAGFGVTIGFHRLLTHRAFETYQPVRLAMAILGSSAAQGMCIRWVATHRRHHQQADRDGDPHSPHLHGHGFVGSLRGFFHAHVGWCFEADRPNLARSVPDLLGDRAMLLVDQLYFLWVGLGLIIPGVVLGLLMHSWHGFWAGVIWGGFVRVCLMQHVTWSINSVCHVWGARPFRNTDYSTNNFPIAIVSLGEGWHNNHHAFPTSARHGLRWWQFDSSYVVIVLMKYLGLAWNIRLPNATAIKARQAPALVAPARAPAESAAAMD